MESTSSWWLVTLGALLLAGYLTHVAGRRAHVPRVTLLLLLGAAVRLGLLAAQQAPGVGAGLISLLVGTTVLFEIAGPILTRVALRRAGEVRSG